MEIEEINELIRKKTLAYVEEYDELVYNRLMEWGVV